MKSFPSPCCEASLFYEIRMDAYVCQCGKAYSVLSTEQDHVLYDGGPPKEVKNGCSST
jgi:hypothetical protein